MQALKPLVPYYKCGVNAGLYNLSLTRLSYLSASLALLKISKNFHLAIGEKTLDLLTRARSLASTSS